ncbi:MAG: hypothetical protein GVY13_00905 [Alphaproteobacteria bacterium]|jgi:hemerythrin-like metal-binding protein|nr:hypothetical protein [Alphaproteobacteria bacterium]
MKSPDIWLGHEELDRQHEDLADAVARFSFASRQNEMTQAINDFFEIWRVHTAFEEHLMARSDFPYGAMHMDDHCRITRDISVLFRHSIRDGFTDKDRIITHLDDWFEGHLLRYDRMLVEHLMRERVPLL